MAPAGIQSLLTTVPKVNLFAFGRFSLTPYPHALILRPRPGRPGFRLPRLLAFRSAHGLPARLSLSVVILVS